MTLDNLVVPLALLFTIGALSWSSYLHAKIARDAHTQLVDMSGLATGQRVVDARWRNPQPEQHREREPVSIPKREDRWEPWSSQNPPSDL
jgi:hypothetical protein